MPNLKVLSLSDVQLPKIYSEEIRRLYSDVDLVLGCGDLPYFYLEYVVDMLGKPVFFVRGNHDSAIEFSQKGDRSHPWGAEDLHRRVICHEGLLIAGLEGSVRYSSGRFQYTQSEMWELVLRLVPALFWNFLRHGRALDVLVAHSPMWDFMDRPDPAHRGFKALRWLVRVFRPKYFFHGHIHVDGTEQRYGEFRNTKVINSTGAVVTEIQLNG